MSGITTSDTVTCRYEQEFKRPDLSSKELNSIQSQYYHSLLDKWILSYLTGQINTVLYFGNQDARTLTECESVVQQNKNPSKLKVLHIKHAWSELLLIPIKKADVWTQLSADNEIT